MSALTEHFLMERRQLRQQPTCVIRPTIGDTSLDARLAGRSERRIDGAETLPHHPDPTSVKIVTPFQRIDHGTDHASPLVGRWKMKRRLALAGAVDRERGHAAGDEGR